MSFKTSIDFPDLYKNELSSDVKFILRDRNGVEQIIPAHKILLRSRSREFERLFNFEKRKCDSIVVTEVSAEGFSEFLQYFYRPVTLTAKNLPEVFMLSDKYDTPALRTFCEKFLEETMCPDTMCVYYDLALLYDLPNIVIRKLENMISRHFKEASNRSVSGGGFTKSNLISLLQSESFPHRESNIFHNVITWAEKSLQRQNMDATVANVEMAISDLLPYIRFPTMTMIELLTCLEKYPNLVTRTELLDIQYYILEKRPLTVAKRFSTEVRQDITTLIDYTCRNDALYCATMDHFHMEMMVTKRYLITITLTQGNQCICKIYNGYVTFDYDSPPIYEQNFDEKDTTFTLSQPVEFKIGQKYTIEVTVYISKKATNYLVPSCQRQDIYPFQFKSPYSGSLMTKLEFTDIFD